MIYFAMVKSFFNYLVVFCRLRNIRNDDPNENIREDEVTKENEDHGEDATSRKSLLVEIILNFCPSI